MTFLPSHSIAAAQQLAGIVHGDGGQPEVAALLETMDRHGLYALAVTLAAMVDVDRTPTELLAWTVPEPGWAQHQHARFNAGHRDEDALYGEQLYQRDRKREQRWWRRFGTTAAPCLDETAIQRACAGEPVKLTTPERVAAVRKLHARGRLVHQIANDLHMSGTRVQQILAAPSSTDEDFPCQAGVAPSSQTNRREAS